MGTNDVYIMHYGVKRRSGRYPFGSGKRPFQSAKGALAKRRTPEAKAERINKRASKKLGKIEERRSAAQKEADKYYNKAVKKSAGLFGSQKKVNKALERAAGAQKSVNALEYKGQKQYQKALRKLGKVNGKVDPNVQKLGERYIKNVAANSKSVYNAMLTSSTAGVRYKRRR